jgi:hypothetical protein
MWRCLALQGPAGINLVSGEGKGRDDTGKLCERTPPPPTPRFTILECHAFLRHHPFSNPPAETRRGGRQRNSFAPE